MNVTNRGIKIDAKRNVFPEKKNEDWKQHKKGRTYTRESCALLKEKWLLLMRYVADVE